MAKVYFNSRDELIAVDIDRVAVIRADGNYTHIIYMNKHEVTLSQGITKVTEMLSRHQTERTRFIRISRSVIINHVFMERIDVQRQFIVLVDGRGNEIRVRASKPVLKSYKNAVVNVDN